LRVDFRLSPDDATLRDEVCAFLQRLLGTTHTSDPRPVSPLGLDREFNRAMGARGFLGVSWPKEYGGGGRPITAQFVVDEEMLLHGAPCTESDTRLVSSLLFKAATDEQKARYGPAAVRGEIEFCSGWTEPGAGSDLAGLQTTALRDGDEYVINGTKIFNTNAHRADVCWLLVRTNSDAEKHAGISILLVPMDTPGVQALPLQDITGEAQFSQMHFDNVRVPVTSVVGEEGGGWRVMATAMSTEGLMVYRALAHKRVLLALRRFLRDRGRRMDDAVRYELEQRLAQLAIEFEVASLLMYRGLDVYVRGEDSRGTSAVSKMFNSEVTRRLYQAAFDVLGPFGQLFGDSPHALWEGTVPTLFLSTVQDTIAGGTSEVQRNNIANRLIKLPRA
jgi:alkylation response protein AidB-like acyl-CoA dehydrogenase